jgi:hypothetical protein
MGQTRAGKDTTADYLQKEHRFVRIGLADPMKRFLKEIFDFSDAQLWGKDREKPDPRYIRMKRGAIGSSNKRAFRQPDGSFNLEDTVYAGKEKLWQELADEYGNVPTPDEDQHLSARYALQTLGTEWGRACYNDVWIDYGIRVAKMILSNPRHGYVPSQGLFTACEADDDWPEAQGVVFSDLRFSNEFDAVKKAGGILVRILRPGFDGETESGIAFHASEEEQKSFENDEFDLILRNDGTVEDLYARIEQDLIPLIKRRQ